MYNVGNQKGGKARCAGEVMDIPEEIMQDLAAVETRLESIASIADAKAEKLEGDAKTQLSRMAANMRETASWVNRVGRKLTGLGS